MAPRLVGRTEDKTFLDGNDPNHLNQRWINRWIDCCDWSCSWWVLPNIQWIFITHIDMNVIQNSRTKYYWLVALWAVGMRRGEGFIQMLSMATCHPLLRTLKCIKCGKSGCRHCCVTVLYLLWFHTHLLAECKCYRKEFSWDTWSRGDPDPLQRSQSLDNSSTGPETMVYQ